ncbi:MAG: SIMPL domain-containing protein [Solirubrobacteraceae bacterium]
MLRSRYAWTLGMVAALSLLGGAAPAIADSTTSTLTVDGSGSVFVTPDVADLSVIISRSAASSRGALSLANRATGGLVLAVRHAGVSASAIQTQDVNVSSRTVRSGPHRHRERRWIATESLAIHITTISQTGPVIDAATRAGASNVDGPTFSFSDPSAGKLAATRAAIADARRRADDAAAAIGYQVSGVQSLVIDPQSPPLLAAAGAPSQSAAGSPVATRVHPGREEVDAQVEIVYTIAPA